MASAAIVHKLWNYCNVLRDEGMRDTYEGLLEAAPFPPWNRGIRTSLFIKDALEALKGT